jgi:hypothetical protein
MIISDLDYQQLTSAQLIGGTVKTPPKAKPPKAKPVSQVAFAITFTKGNLLAFGTFVTTTNVGSGSFSN